MKPQVKMMRYVKLSQILKLFSEGIRERVNDKIENSSISYGADIQSTFISKDSFLELIDDLFEGDDLSDDELVTLISALREGIKNVKNNVSKMTFIMIEG